MNIINEIFQTEKDYVSNLSILVTHGMNKCRARHDILTTEEFKTLFSNMIELLEFHEKLLIDISEGTITN